MYFSNLLIRFWENLQKALALSQKILYIYYRSLNLPGRVIGNSGDFGSPVGGSSPPRAATRRGRKSLRLFCLQFIKNVHLGIQTTRARFYGSN